MPLSILESGEVYFSGWTKIFPYFFDNLPVLICIQRYIL